MYKSTELTNEILEQVVLLERLCFDDCWKADDILDTMKWEHNYLIIIVENDTDSACFTMQGGKVPTILQEKSEAEEKPECIKGKSEAGEKAEQAVEKNVAEMFKAGGRICGYLIYNLIADESELLRVAVECEYRNKGCGRRLVSRYFDNISVGAVGSMLEVRHNNYPAIKLYEQMGYEKLAVRKKYYANPVADAIIYKKVFS